MSNTTLFADPNRWVRAPEIQAHFGLTQGGSATLWRWVKQGKLPQPHYLNRQRVWRAAEVAAAEEKLLASRHHHAGGLEAQK
jgi:predicted DNA-binding transcriptional regulator AlpA